MVVTEDDFGPRLASWCNRIARGPHEAEVQSSILSDAIFYRSSWLVYQEHGGLMTLRGRCNPFTSYLYGPVR